MCPRCKVFFYDGMSDGAEQHLGILCHTLPASPFFFGKSFELYSHAEFYKFISEYTVESVKRSVVAEQLCSAVASERETETANT